MGKLILIFLAFGYINAQNLSNINLESFPGERCYRCCKNAVPQVCYFKWHLEHYHVLGPACGTCGSPTGNTTDCFNYQCVTADGVERGIMTINRQLPGPSIHVCQGDLVVVDVINMMGGTSATIHWHGFHQRATPFMDGVPFITQCPIDFATKFRYSFNATEPGTQFYHSHAGHHKANGHNGGIVVRRSSKKDPNSSLYDRDKKDHLIVITDWMDEDAEMFFPGLRTRGLGAVPTNFLINGKGTLHDSNTGKSTTGTPLASFVVERGFKYRFRLVNAMSLICPSQIEIEGHSMTLIASDSFDLQPKTVDVLFSQAGERYDFVINANQTGDTYFIRLRALGICESRQLEQFAVLSYKPATVKKSLLGYPERTFPPYSQKFSIGRSFNNPNTTCGEDPNHLCITDMSSYESSVEIANAVPDYRFCLGFENHVITKPEVFNEDYEHFFNGRGDTVQRAAINNISFVFPPFSPLTQPEEVNSTVFCDEKHLPESCAGKTICACVHRLKVALNSIVELVIADTTNSVNQVNHPFHLHGYKVFVLRMAQASVPMTDALTKAMCKARNLNITPNDFHALKDTVSIPSKGFAVFRFKADNPGWWLLHCHFEWHFAIGMGLVLQVGEPSEMVTAPKNFPTCNNYLPDIDSSILGTL